MEGMRPVGYDRQRLEDSHRQMKNLLVGAAKEQKGLLQEKSAADGEEEKRFYRELLSEKEKQNQKQRVAHMKKGLTITEAKMKQKQQKKRQLTAVAVTSACLSDGNSSVASSSRADGANEGEDEYIQTVLADGGEDRP